MPILKTATKLALALTLAAAPLSAQELQQVGNRQCAVEGTSLHTFVSSQLPGCDYYCLVDKSVLPEYQDYPGEVFSCVDRRDLAAPPPQDDDGLGVAALGGLLGIGLLLGAMAQSEAGATSDTQ